MKPKQVHNKMTDEQRAFIVMSLARYLPNVEIQRAFLDRFGREVSHRRIYDYNPERSRPLPKKWLDLFAATRKEFIDEVKAIPIANPAWRLQRLQVLYEKAAKDDRPNIPLAAALLEQAAKESGGSFTNRTESKLVVKDVTPPKPDTGEQRAILTAAIADALEAHRPAADTRH